MLQAKNVLQVKTETDYHDSLALIEYLFDEVTDSEDDPLNILIEIVSCSIEQYESRQGNIIEFEKQVAEIDPGISILRTLIDQFNLTVADFAAEIGSKSLVSKILNGQISLTEEHISKLAKRFNLEPALFH